MLFIYRIYDADELLLFVTDNISLAMREYWWPRHRRVESEPCNSADILMSQLERVIAEEKPEFSPLLLSRRRSQHYGRLLGDNICPRCQTAPRFPQRGYCLDCSRKYQRRYRLDRKKEGPKPGRTRKVTPSTMEPAG